MKKFNKTKMTESIYMAIPGSDFDRIEWIKGVDIIDASRTLNTILDLTDEELGDCGYHIFQVPNIELFDVINENYISRVDTNFGEYMSY